MTAWVLAGVVGAAVASGASANAEVRPGAGSGLTIAVDLTDNVHVPPQELAEAEDRVAASYRAVGIDVVWHAAPAMSGTPAGPWRIIPVRVVLVPHDKAEAKCDQEGLGQTVTGIAVSGAPDARGRIAYIFYNRLERLALTQGAPVSRGLGHVMAHEIGHLLLGVNSHSHDGLMQPNWLPRETHVQTLTKDQVRAVWRRFAESETVAHSGAEPTLP
ncbi:MAG TPA: hypothetical protein VGY48_26625 [Vicinamibacterales bacterium]|jgi:hypothetical protein|nr:hypothetical protein [Vicinamibacterales bacterium]